MSKKLIEQLAASQAREAKLRETLEESKDFFDREVGSSHLFRRLTIKDIEEALSQPTDDTALREMITKAGEVMRERCIGVSQDEMDEQFVDSDPWYSARSCRDSIRDLPAVTLDDLNGGA